MNMTEMPDPSEDVDVWPLSNSQLQLLVDEQLRGPDTAAYVVVTGWSLAPAPPTAFLRSALEEVVARLPMLRCWVVPDVDAGWAARRSSSRLVDLHECEGEHPPISAGPGTSYLTVLPSRWAGHLRSATVRGRLVPLPAIYCQHSDHGDRGLLLLGLDHVFVDGLVLPHLDAALGSALDSWSGRGEQHPAAGYGPRDPSLAAAAGAPVAVVGAKLPRQLVKDLRAAATAQSVTLFSVVGAVLRRIEADAAKAGRFAVAVADSNPIDADGEVTTDRGPAAIAQVLALPASATDAGEPRRFARDVARAGLVSRRAQDALTVLVEEPRRRSIEARGVLLRPCPPMSVGQRYQRLWVLRVIDATVELALEVPVDQVEVARALLAEAQARLADAERGEGLASEQQLELVMWGEPRPLSTLSVTDLVDQAARRWSYRTAISAPDGEVSYGRLSDTVASAQVDLEHRTMPGEAVLVRAARSWRQAAALLAVLRSGRVYVPYDEARFGPGSLLEVAESIGARWLLSWDDGQPFAWEALPPSSASPGSSLARHDHPAYVLFTSGSTGKPKSVYIGHKTLLNLVQWQLKRSAADETWSTLQFAAATFDVSLQETLSTLASGGRLVVTTEVARRDPWEVARLIRTQGVRRIFVPYVVLSHLAEATANDAKPLGLREIITAGEALQMTDPLRRWLSRERGVTLDNQYGPTETHVVTAHRLEGEPAAWPTLPAIGAPLPNVGVALLAADGRAVPRDDRTTQGELCVVGVAVGLGYGGAAQGGFGSIPDLGEAGWRAYRTGDLARWDGDGGLQFLGRRDDQVKISGIRIELGEVEARLREQPSIRDATAAVLSSGGVKRLAAFVVLEQPNSISGGALRRRLSAALPAHLVPSRLSMVDSLPVTAHGKVDRRRLVESLSSAEISTARGPTGQPDEVSMIWQDVLGEPPVSESHTFFEAGGDSLAAVRFLGRLEKQTGSYLSLRDFIREPTVSAVRRHVRKSAVPTGHHATGRPVVILRRREADHIWVFLPPMSGAVTRYARMPRLLPEPVAVWACETPTDEEAADIHTVAERLAGALVETGLQKFSRVRLAGFSLGAVLALEVARALERRKLPAALAGRLHVQLLDPPPLRTSAPSITEIFEIFVRYGWAVQGPLGDFWQGDAPDAARLASAAKDAGMLEPGAPDRVVAGAWRVYVNNARLLEDYDPTPLDKTPVSLLRCVGLVAGHPRTWKQQPVPSDWVGIVKPELSVVLDTEHFSLLVPPTDEVVAEWLVANASAAARDWPAPRSAEQPREVGPCAFGATS